MANNFSRLNNIIGGKQNEKNYSCFNAISVDFINRGRGWSKQ